MSELSRTTPQDAWPHGVIELEGCAVEVESAKPEEEKKKKKKGQFVFLIMNPTVGSTRFCGASERERAEWVTAIDMACRNAGASTTIITIIAVLL
jgi:hypothetical protein